MINVDEVTAAALHFCTDGRFLRQVLRKCHFKEGGALNNVRSELLRPRQSQD